MGKIRTILFGYQMEQGKIMTSPSESITVSQIFELYAQGYSYKIIANQLSTRQIPYHSDKNVWNKNMVARILQTEYHKDSEKYSALIPFDLYQLAQSQMKPYTHTTTPEIKALKSKLYCSTCGTPVIRLVTPSGSERWKCPSDYKHINVNCSDSALLEQLEAFRVEKPITVCENSEDSSILQKISLLDKELKTEKELSFEQRIEKLQELVQLRYQLCQPQDEHEFFLDWLNQVEKISLIGTNITQVVTKDGKIIRKEEMS
ncbi:MAG: recombinase family protein [Eubacteriales bacterium]